MQNQSVCNVRETEFSEQKNIEKTVKMLSFTLDKEIYSIDINDAREMINIGYITRVPYTPDFVIGVMNVRGEIVTIIDIKKLLGLETKSKTSDSKIILTDIMGFLIGIWVDNVNGTIDIAQALIQPAPASIENSMPRYIKGQFKIDKQLLILLNIKKILASEKLQSLEHKKQDAKTGLSGMNED